MGEDRSGRRPEVGVRAIGIKPQPDRLYGRRTGHKLRPRQELLIEATLPRLRFDTACAADPMAGFAPGPRELWFEVGFGGGEHAFALAQSHPEAALIACEVFEQGLCSMLARLVPEGGEVEGALSGNLRLWDDDARDLLRLLPDASVTRLFLMFPDPWPKARHAKRRFVHPALLPELARVVKPGGMWRIASDDPTYQEWVAEVLAAQSLFDAPPPATARPEGWPPTRYEAKALAAGRTPLYWEVTRRG